MASGRSGRRPGRLERAIIDLRSTVKSELGGRVAMEAGPRDRAQDEPDGLIPDGPDETAGMGPQDDGDPDRDPDSDAEGGESFRELRPQRLLRVWQLAPVVILSAIGSLMFAFPLAFEFGDGGAVVAMLGLLISCCAAGWGMMAARRVGITWPGLPKRGSGIRPDWRVIGVYTLTSALLVALAVWRVARLR